MKKKINKLFYMMIVMFLLSITTYQISYAQTIPDKSTFREYIKKIYYLEGADEDKVDKAILDYKDRYIMYVDSAYVQGKINQARTLDIYYLLDNKGYEVNYNDELQTIKPDPNPISDNTKPGDDNNGLVTDDGEKDKVGSVTPIDADEQKQYIWDFLISKGYSEIAVAGIMGNLQAESGCRSNNVQGSYRQKNPEKYNDDYTKQVDNGDITRDEFVNHGPNGGGYGIAQYTYYTYKEQLYDEAKARGVSISDLQLQCEMLDNALSKYKSTLNSMTTVYDAAELVLVKFERPDDQSDDVKEARAANGRGMYLNFTGNQAPDAEGAGYDYSIFFQGKKPDTFKGMEYYGDHKIKGKSFAEIGAAPTAVAMITSNLTKYKTPIDVCNDNESNMTKEGAKLDVLLDVEKYNLKVSSIGKDTTKLYEALNKGKMAIAVTGSKEMGGVTGIFNRTSDCNFIVILGIKDNGYLEVADPDGGNYYNIESKDISYQLIKGEAVGGIYVYEPLD